MITIPMPFQEAIAFLLWKGPLPAKWDAAMWAQQEPDFQTQTFFSAKVENSRFLDRAQGLIFDYMANVTETIIPPDGTTVTALKVAGHEHFVRRMREFMIAEGMANVGEFKDVNQQDVTDIRSVARLRLAFDTNLRQAFGYGQWKQGTKPGCCAPKAAKPRTIFMEPVNLRLGIAERIQEEARKLGRDIDMTPYRDPFAWVHYAVQALKDAERAAKETDQLERLHLWPDFKAMGGKRARNLQSDPAAYLQWLQGYWDRISEWPGKSG